MDRPGIGAYPGLEGGTLDGRAALVSSSGLRSLSRIRRIFQAAAGRSPVKGGDGSASLTPTPDKAEIPGFTTPQRSYQTIVGFDIAGFGGRDEHVQDHVRGALYRLLKDAFTAAGIPWPQQGWREDRGDGALMIVPPKIPADRVVGTLVQQIHAELRRYNKVSSEAAQITLRMAIHGGFVQRDENGLSGQDLLFLCRVLEAPAFKNAVRLSGATLGVVVSTHIYDGVVRHGPGIIDPDSFGPLNAVNKETSAVVWLRLCGGGGSAVQGSISGGYAEP